MVVIHDGGDGGGNGLPSNAFPEHGSRSGRESSAPYSFVPQSCSLHADNTYITTYIK